MTYEEFIFYVIAAVAVAGGIGVVTARNVVHSAVFLILALLAVAAVYVLLVGLLSNLFRAGNNVFVPRLTSVFGAGGRLQQ